jgi:acetyl esterase/lipase
MAMFCWLSAPKLILVLGLMMFFACAALAAIPSEPAKESNHPASISLWPNGAPGSESRKGEAEKVDWRDEPENNITFSITFNIHSPSITPYLPAKDKASGAAIIIAPGGGHMFLTMDREGYDCAKWFADHGVAAFVLKYRLAKDRAGNSRYKVDPDALNDALRAIRVVRSRAAEWEVNPSRIGIIGFSAGGEIAALAETRFDKGKESSADPVERQSSRPDYVGLIYPGGDPDRLKFTSETPPTFLLCAYNDSMATTNIPKLFDKLRAAKVPTEVHIYNSGGHGFGVRERPIPVSNWTARLHEWMGDLGMLSRQ